MFRPKVLVLLASHNGSNWILEQVASILDQLDVDVSLVISDDGSTDDTRSRLNNYSDDPRVDVISPTSATGSAAQNFFWLIRSRPAAQYEFIALADQDDIWPREKLACACAALKASGAGGYSCATIAFWPEGRTAILRQANRLTSSDFLFEGAGQGCTYVLGGSFYEKVHDFLTRSYEVTGSIHYHDWTIYALSRLWSVPWHFDPRPMLKYRQHASNDSGARASVIGIRRRIKRIKDGWYSRQLREIALVSLRAAPNNATIIEWIRLLDGSKGLKRRLRIFLFCLRGGRRRRTDQLILLFAVLAGWI
jgi:rhamnosyltransferase